jgi:hypothetical protein
MQCHKTLLMNMKVLSEPVLRVCNKYYCSYVEKRAFSLFFSYVEVNLQNINIFGVTLAILLQMCIYMILRYNSKTCLANNNALRGNVSSHC